MTRKAIPLAGGKDGRLGRRGAMVRAFTDGDLARVFWSESGRQRKESWPNTPAGRAEAKAYAEGVAERLAHKGPAAIPAITLRELFDAYWLAESPGLRGKTQIGYRVRWKQFELFAGRSTLAHTVTLERLDEYRRALTTQGRAINQVGHLIGTVKRVYRWAIARDLIPPSKVPSYRFKVKRGEKRIEMAEYRTEEAERILAQWSTKDARAWRPYVATVLFAFAGPRQSAALQLEWRDIDFEAGEIHWRPELDKIGHDRRQPMPEQVREAMWIAYGWRLATGYTGPFVFYGATAASRGQVRTPKAWELLPKNQRPAPAKVRAVLDKPWTYSAYNQALRNAEAAADVPHVKYRAAHGWRRMAAGNVLELTGNVKDALDWIGDKDLRVGQRYLRGRNDRMDAVAGLLTGDSAATQNGPETDPSKSSGENEAVKAVESTPN
ncbi:MAG: tyrosine-type recombinase/integrase [Gemmatimonadaceae bacterium]|nr:tyrosine-type recombinase/integrase [Gemmatimonadaceae bacterium]